MAYSRKNRSDFEYEIIESLISVPEEDSDWTLELNRVRWGSNEPKFDLRKWSPVDSKGERKMSRGVTFTDGGLVRFLKEVPELYFKLTGERMGAQTIPDADDMELPFE